MNYIRQKNEKRKAERLWRRSGLTVHKEINTVKKLKYDPLLLDSKVTYFNERIREYGNDDLLFRHKVTTNCQHTVLRQTWQIDLQHFLKKKLTKSEMSYLIALTST